MKKLLRRARVLYSGPPINLCTTRAATSFLTKAFNNNLHDPLIRKDDGAWLHTNCGESHKGLDDGEYDGSSITLSSGYGQYNYSYKLPGKIAEKLYPHQREGLEWLWGLHCQGKGGFLADDMGLGKTRLMCAFLAGMFHSAGLIKRVIIVVPSTLVSHWKEEMSRVDLSDKIIESSGGVETKNKIKNLLQSGCEGIVITTYGIVKHNSSSFKDGIWDYLILDEGHLIRNPSTKRAKSLQDIPSSYRFIISGTPLQNNLKEIWALYDFCCPGLLGYSYRFDFKSEFGDRIHRGNFRNASDRQKLSASMAAEELRDRIKPNTLRRLKSDVFGDGKDQTYATLPKKIELTVWTRLSSCQKEAVLSKCEAFLRGEVLSADEGCVLASLTILRKICDHPRLLMTKLADEDVVNEWDDSTLKPDNACMAEKRVVCVSDASGSENLVEDHAILSCKIYIILSLLNNLIPEGHNVLIFSQTKMMLDLIQESLISHGYKFLRIDGDTEATERIRIINDFQEGDGAPILLLTSQVGGVGLTLTRADRVILVNPAWNPSTDNQCVDRAYRIGQDKAVIVYRLMTCGTIEEMIYRLQIFKVGLFKAVTEHEEPQRYFREQDFLDVGRLPVCFDVSFTQKLLYEEHDRHHTVEESLQSHIEFLETLGIAGVNHHSLLFSKTEPPKLVVEGDQEARELIKVNDIFPGKSNNQLVKVN